MREYGQRSYNMKVVLHNLSIDFNNINADLYNFDQNGIFFAEPGDVVITRNEIPPQYRKFLVGAGFNFEETQFVCAPQTVTRNYSDIFKADFFPTGTAQLDTFMLTKLESDWATQHSVAYEGNADNYVQFGTKSDFRKTAKGQSIAVPKGYEEINGQTQCALRILFLSLHGVKEVVIKHDEGAAGVGTKRFQIAELIKDPSVLTDYFRTSQNKFNPKRERNRYVIEKWYDDVKSSPSIQFYITSSSEVKLVSMHGQLFYENRIRYKGCLSEAWVEEPVKSQLIKEGYLLAKEYADRGYKGHLGFNAIELKNTPQLIWVELNSRRVMSSYPFQIHKKLFSKTQQPPIYISTHIQKAKWVGKTIEEILLELKGFLFSPATKCGIVPFDYGLLRAEGRMSVVFFSDTKEGVISLLKDVENL